MTSWFRRKRHDVRHAVQELRAGDAIDRERSTVRTTIVGGRPPGDDARVPVPMGIERVLRKAASDARFEARLLGDREPALATSGLTLTPAENAILLSTSPEQFAAMVEQIRPTLSPRRGFLKRLAAAAGMALFGAGMAGSQISCMKDKTEGDTADMPELRPSDTGPRKSELATTGATVAVPPETERPAKTWGISPDTVEPRAEEAEGEGE